MKFFTGDTPHFNYGENNPSYRGNKATYGAIHCWVRRRKPRPVCCELCGEIKNTEIALKGEKYTRDINDYWYLCRRCHMLTDGRGSKARIRQEKIKFKDKNCIFCNTQFHPKRITQKSCSWKCNTLARRAGLVSSWR